MEKFASTALIVMFVVLAGGMMLGGGEHPLRVAIVLTGIVIFMARGNAVIARGRRRRGKPVDFTFDYRDWGALTRRDWIELVLTQVFSVALTFAGFAAFRGGA
jgi:hypothetical protein